MEGLGLNFDGSLEKVWAPWMAYKKVGVQERAFEAHGRDSVFNNTHTHNRPLLQESSASPFYLGEYYENFYIKKL